MCDRQDGLCASTLFEASNLYPKGYYCVCCIIVCTLTGIKVATTVDIIPVRVYFYAMGAKRI